MKKSLSISIHFIMIFGIQLFLVFSSFGDSLIREEIASYSDHPSVLNRISETEYSEGVFHHRLVKLNTDLIPDENSELFSLEIEMGLGVTIVRNSCKKTADNGFVFKGYINGSESSMVTLSVQGQDLAGSIWYEGSLYRIRPLGDEIHSIYEVDVNEADICAPPVQKKGEDLRKKSVINEAEKNDYLIAQSGIMTIIDVMVVYTSAAASKSGNIQSEIRLAIEDTNRFYENSGVMHRVRLVKFHEVSEAETGNVYDDLERIRNPHDGFIDEIHDIRDEYGADVVSYWTAQGSSYCGLAYLMEGSASGFSDYAFNVIVVSNSCSTKSFAHELSHIMGAGHDVYVKGSGYFDYSHGYVYLDWDERFSTIMAYQDECNERGVSCNRIPNFSNPSVTYRNIPTGSESADVARTLNYTSVSIAGFRESMVDSSIEFNFQNGRGEAKGSCFVRTLFY